MVNTFKLASIFVFVFILFIFCLGTYVAFNKKSGSTGLDMGKVKQLRNEQSTT